MFFAIAALLLQPQVAPQLSISTEKIALIQPVNAAISTTPVTGERSSLIAPEIGNNEVADASALTVEESSRAALPDALVPASVEYVSAPAALTFVKPARPMTVSVGELFAENRHNQRLWKGLAIASHGAATFDAWSTRRSISKYGGVEMNPLLKPFAGNSSIYAAIQVGPLLMDYAGKKMMSSRHSWVRNMWWVPQSASFVSSLFCGVHNLTVR